MGNANFCVLPRTLFSADDQKRRACLVDVDKVLVVKVSHVLETLVFIKGPVLLVITCRCIPGLDGFADLSLLRPEHRLVYDLGTLSELLALLCVPAVEVHEVKGDESTVSGQYGMFAYSKQHHTYPDMAPTRMNMIRLAISPGRYNGAWLGLYS